MPHVRIGKDAADHQLCDKIVTCKVTAQMKSDLFDIVGEGHISAFIRQTLKMALGRKKANRAKFNRRN